MTINRYCRLLILICLLAVNSTIYADEERVILRGSANRVIQKNNAVRISMNSLISSEINKEGDRVEAKLLIDKSVKDPALALFRGALLSGHISEISHSRRAGRNGKMKIIFDDIKLSTGDHIPMHAEMSSEDFRGQSALKTLREDFKLIGRGALWGTVASFRWAPVSAITTEGLSLAVGAGIGVSLGIIGSIRRSGDSYTLTAGNNETIEFKNDLLVNNEILDKAILSHKLVTNELIGLDLGLLESRFLKNDIYDNVLRLKVQINNNSKTILSPTDIVLRPLNGDDIIVPDLRMSQLDLLQLIYAGDERELTLYYPLEEVKYINDFELVLLDPISKDHIAHLELNYKNISNKKASN